MTLALLVVLGLMGSALCAGTETGYYALNPLKLRVRAASSRLAAVLMRIIRPPHAFLTMLLVGNNLSDFLAVSSLVALLASLGVSQPEVLATVVLTPLSFLFGEVGPKQLVLQNPLRSLISFTPILALLRVVLLPVTWVLGLLGRLIAREDAEVLAGRRHLAALLTEGGRAAQGDAPVLKAALRALESAGQGLRPWLRTDLPLLHPGIGLAEARAALAQTPDTLGLLDRRGRAPALLLGSRLVHASPGTPVAQLAADLPLLDPGDDLADALARLRAEEASFGLVGSPDAVEGVLDLEHALSLLLRPEVRPPHV